MLRVERSSLKMHYYTRVRGWVPLSNKTKFYVGSREGFFLLFKIIAQAWYKITGEQMLADSLKFLRLFFSPRSATFTESLPKYRLDLWEAVETVTLIFLNVTDLPRLEHFAKPLGECLRVARQNAEQKYPSALMLILAGCKCVSQVGAASWFLNIAGESQAVRLILKLLAN